MANATRHSRFSRERGCLTMARRKDRSSAILRLTVSRFTGFLWDLPVLTCIVRAFRGLLGSRSKFIQNARLSGSCEFTGIRIADVAWGRFGLVQKALCTFS
ncbi:hypothetical protein FVE85_3364 [Porphyridium purpureum]|uniref:Uncharacterized protein n=1 Tax=Porphyridium purpureum TaxID=35688 RepID=A0A5J4YWM7_PORPP|nr:hypothetical protein FVE85_3364 [Porphyridium purpureum]|eukprot:POR3675..scf227_4